MKIAAKSSPGKAKASTKKFPLTAHRGANQWVKKIRGKQYYFGKLDDPDSALKRYLSERDDLAAGRKPRTTSDASGAAILLVLVNQFLTFKRQLVASGELKNRTFQDYHEACTLLLAGIDKSRLVEDLDSDDFLHLRSTISKNVGPVSTSNRIRQIRMIFKFAYDQGLIDKPIRYGQGFNAPRKQVMRLDRQKIGSRMLERHEIIQLMDASPPIMRAMILLGLNAGFGNHDVGLLPRRVIDVTRGWITWPRPKTSIERKAPLWPETIEALNKADPLRPKPVSESLDELFFLTRQGDSWYKDSKATPLSAEFRKLLNKTGLYRRGLGFYSLRRTFETIAGSTGDQIATNLIMGHADQSMAAVYRQRVDDERLLKVSTHVHDWLFLEKNS
ncbi:MAG: hypothetical protein O3C21_00505 [Verrucomicrobia bacterium]|nr:hypothetical protein [Verrucomicrobiota bacterium]